MSDDSETSSIEERKVVAGAEHKCKNCPHCHKCHHCTKGHQCPHKRGKKPGKKPGQGGRPGGGRPQGGQGGGGNGLCGKLCCFGKGKGNTIQGNDCTLLIIEFIN